MLSDFFRINLPYGIERKDNNEWTAFNREYAPIGFNEKHFRFPDNCQFAIKDLPIYTDYKGITEKLLLKFEDSEMEHAIYRNDKGEIIRIFLYNDSTSPMNQTKDNPELWKRYFEKLKILSKLQIR